MKQTTTTRYDRMNAAKLITSRLVHDVERKLTDEQVDAILAAKAKVSEAVMEMNRHIADAAIGILH